MKEKKYTSKEVKQIVNEVEALAFFNSWLILFLITLLLEMLLFIVKPVSSIIPLIVFICLMMFFYLWGMAIRIYPKKFKWMGKEE